MLRSLALACLLLLVPAASAGYQPVTYFLADGETGPAGNGILTAQPPAPLDMVNPANNSPPGVRMVLPAPLPATQFVMLNSTDNTGWILGPVFLMLWAPESQAMQKGNVTVKLVVFDPEAIPGVDTPTVLASATQPNDASNLTPPDPMTFIPPDPTDPEASLAYVQGRLLAYGLPMVLQYPMLFFLDDNTTDGYVNQQIDPDAQLALQITLEPGSSEAPIAQGSQAIEYDFALSPSLFYIPWYQIEDPAVLPPPTPPAPPTSPPVSPPSDDDDEDAESDGDKGSPGFGMVAALAAVGAAFVLRRKK